VPVPRSVSALLFAPALLGAAERFDGELKPTAEFVVASESVFRGLERAGHSAQAAVGVERGAFRGGLWASVPLRGGEADELRLDAAWRQPLGGQFELEAGVRMFRFLNAPAGAPRHSWEAGLKLSREMPGGLKPALGYYRDFRLQADTGEGELGFSVPLTRLGAFLDGRFFAGWSQADDWRPGASGPRVAGGYGYYGVEAKVPYRIGEHTTVLAGLHYSEAWNAREAGAVPGPKGRRNLGFTAGVSLDF